MLLIVASMVSIISGQKGRVKPFSEKLLLCSRSVDQLVAVPLLHDVANGQAKANSGVSVEGLVILKHHDGAVARGEGIRTSEDDHVSFHISIRGKTQQTEGDFSDLFWVVLMFFSL